MLLKITRSQKEGGLISTTAIFCLDARVSYTEDELRCVQRYKLGGLVVYDSQARTQMAERSALAAAQGGKPANFSGDVGGMLAGGALSLMSGAFSGAKSLAFAAIASMKLRITIRSLQEGHHIECKSLDELLGAEEAILEACRNLKVYLDLAATFNGRDVLYTFEAGGEPKVVATTDSPQPILDPPASPPVAPSVSPPSPAPDPEPIAETDLPDAPSDLTVEDFTEDPESSIPDELSGNVSTPYSPQAKAIVAIAAVVAVLAASHLYFSSNHPLPLLGEPAAGQVQAAASSQRHILPPGAPDEAWFRGGSRIDVTRFYNQDGTSYYVQPCDSYTDDGINRNGEHQFTCG